MWSMWLAGESNPVTRVTRVSDMSGGRHIYVFGCGNRNGTSQVTQSQLGEPTPPRAGKWVGEPDSSWSYSRIRC